MIGIAAWSEAQDIPVENRLYANIPRAQFLGSMMLAYQIYNVGCAIMIADLNTMAFIGHHTMTALLSYFTMHPFVHYYALFFIGIAEATNFPLTFVDATKAFKTLRDDFPIFNQISRISFASSFSSFAWCGGQVFQSSFGGSHLLHSREEQLIATSSWLFFLSVISF